MENANPNLTPDSDSDSIEIITQEYLRKKQKGKTIAHNQKQINNKLKQREMEKRFILEAQKQNILNRKQEELLVNPNSQSQPTIINYYPGRNNIINPNRNRQYYRTDYLNANGLYNNYYLTTRNLQNNYQMPKGIMSLNYTPENAIITSRLGVPGFEYEQQLPQDYVVAEGLGENNIGVLQNENIIINPSVENETPVKTFKDNNMGFNNVNNFEMMMAQNAKKGKYLKKRRKVSTFIFLK